MGFRFELLKTDRSGARLGRIHTPHGAVDTPAFVPFGSMLSCVRSSSAELMSVCIS
jgi:queuine tRNA-ribosyltransferase